MSKIMRMVFFFLFSLLLTTNLMAQVHVERSTEIVKIGGKEYYMHHVKQGETLYGISQVYFVTVEEIEALNPEVKKGLRAGDVIGIPMRLEASKPAEPQHVVPKPVDPQPAESETVVQPVQQPSAPTKPNATPKPVVTGDGVQVGTDYVVLQGEDLYDIAKKFGIDVAEFKAVNPGLTEKPTAGTTIKVPNIVNTDEYIVHKVEYNERTSSLLKRWKVSESEFRKINISVGSQVFVNQVVLIPIAKVNHASETPSQEIDDEEEQPTEIVQTEVVFEEEEPYQIPECNPLSNNASKRYKVALMVPLYLNSLESLNVSKEQVHKAQKSRSMRFLQFYEGFKMAAEQLTQRSGLHLDLTVIDVTDNVSTATSALSQIQGKELDMIIGPFFGKSFEIIEEYAKEQNILVVNPLSTREIIIEGNPNVVKAKAGPTGQIVNLVNLVKRQYRDANVFIVSQELEADTAFLNALEYRLNQAVNAEVTVSNEELLHYAREESERKEMGEKMVTTVDVEGQVYSTEALNANVTGSAVLSNAVKRFAYSDVGSMKSQLSGVRDNMIIAYGNTNVFATQVLNTLKRSADHKPITLVALPDWTKFEKLLVDDLLDMNAIYFSDHFVDYRDPDVKQFVQRFRDRYKAEPQQYAFEGYGVAWYFLNALMQFGPDMIDCLPSYPMQVLHTQYRFAHRGRGNGVENQAWSVFQYEGKEVELVPVDPFQE